MYVIIVWYILVGIEFFESGSGWWRLVNVVNQILVHFSGSWKKMVLPHAEESSLILSG